MAVSCCKFGSRSWLIGSLKSWLIPKDGSKPTEGQSRSGGASSAAANVSMTSSHGSENTPVRQPDRAARRRVQPRGYRRTIDFLEVQGHGVGVAARQDEARCLALGRAYGAEDVKRLRALVVWRRRSCAAPRPPAGDLVLLAHPCFVLEPDLYVLSAGLARRDLCHDRGKFFLNAVAASSSLA